LTPLHIAAQCASLEVVQTLMEQCPDALHFTENGGWLPLHIAAGVASFEVVQCLVDGCPDAILVKDHDGWLLLHCAAKRNESVLVDQFLANKCAEALYVHEKNGWLPVHCAAQSLRLPVTRCLAEMSPEPLLVKENRGWLPLHASVRYGAPVEVVQFLVETNPDARFFRDNKGWLPLHIAASFESLEVNQYLVDKPPETILAADIRVSLQGSGLWWWPSTSCSNTQRLSSRRQPMEASRSTWLASTRSIWTLRCCWKRRCTMKRNRISRLRKDAGGQREKRRIRLARFSSA
jgi:ankyrin repeat protein